jgi:1-acyl-sn-glycerol-3-phosphate acyltransferase
MNTGRLPRLVLAATHPIAFDFLILNFIFSGTRTAGGHSINRSREEFDGFHSLGGPVYGCIFVRRERGHADSELTTSIKTVETLKGTYATFEVFLEGYK